MATQNSKTSRPVSPPTTPTGEESVTPISQPSGLGALSTSLTTESDMKSEVIQRAQIGSLMGANGINEPQNKTPKRQTPTSATRPKKYALEMWVEIETSAGMHTAPEEDSYSVDFAIDCINHAYPRCTGMYLGVAGHMLVFYGKKGRSFAQPSHNHQQGDSQYPHLDGIHCYMESKMHKHLRSERDLVRM